MKTIAENDINLKSTLSELRLFDAQVDISESTASVRQMMNLYPMLPGVILMDGKQYIGMISRKCLIESMSKLYSHDLYTKRSIGFLYNELDNNDEFVLGSNMMIVEAIQKFIAQRRELFSEPILISFGNGTYKILDSSNLLVAHSYLNQIAMNELKQANELKSEMLSIAAHDLKNPLNTIINLTRIVKAFSKDIDAEAYCMIGEIEETSEHMLKLIMELLNSTVIESGRIELRRQIFDVADLIGAIVYQNRTLAENKNQTINFHYNSDEYHFTNGDALKLRESFENILSNAIKYSKYNCEINVKLKREGSRLFFSVQDCGPGLTQEDMRKLFGKFQRLSAVPTGGESSTGLGLYICKQIIEMHNGKIHVDSSLGIGSTFCIELIAEDICL